MTALNVSTGIRELKNRLGYYLRLTRKGVSVVITDRGVPIGRIVPMGQDLAERLAAMRETGLVQWSGQKLRRRKPVAKLLGRKVRSIAGTLAHRGKRMSPTRERAAIMAAVLAEDERTKRKARRRP